MTHRLALTGWLTVAWIGLWGDLSWANVAGGLAVGSLVVAVFNPPQALGLRLRPLRLARFASYFLRNLVHASFQVASIVVRPNATIRTAVIAVPITPTTRGVTLVIAAAISLTPGTLVIDTSHQQHRAILYVHVLDFRDRDTTIAAVARLEQLATAAFAPEPQPIISNTGRNA